MEYQTLFEKYGYCSGLVGIDEDGDPVIVSIDEKDATIQTLQENGRQRITIYYKDGTVEELYKR